MLRARRPVAVAPSPLFEQFKPDIIEMFKPAEPLRPAQAVVDSVVAENLKLKAENAALRDRVLHLEWVLSHGG